MWLEDILVTVWGLCLSIDLLICNWGRGEDFRYQKFRSHSGAKWWWLSYFKVFVLQGILLWIVSVPLLAAQIGQTPARLSILDTLAVLVWGKGFFFEIEGDLQLARFRADPATKGRVLDRGVWRYTRHPSHVGDATQWWVYYLIAAAAGGFWTVVGPIIMTTLLLRVSGVTPKALTTSRPGYRE